MKGELLSLETSKKLARYENTINYLHKLIELYKGDYQMEELFRDILSKLEVSNNGN